MEISLEYATWEPVWKKISDRILNLNNIGEIIYSCVTYVDIIQRKYIIYLIVPYH